MPLRRCPTTTARCTSGRTSTSRTSPRSPRPSITWRGNSARHAGRLLDVGADLTWSTSRLAARGWRPVGIDINHHLAASQALRRRGPAYAVVNMDMHLPAFRDGVFDAITAFNALHHTHRLEALVGTLTAALRPGGRLCVVEPYWFLEEVRQAFGAAAIEAGINENVYRLEEWHRTFVQAGLELVTHTIGHAFNAIYRKRTDGVTRTISLGDAEAELFAGFYRGSVAGPPVLPGLIAPGARVEIPVRVVNGSPLGLEQRRAAARPRRLSHPSPPRRRAGGRGAGESTGFAGRPVAGRQPRRPRRGGAARAAGRLRNSSSTWYRSTCLVLGPGCARLDDPRPRRQPGLMSSLRQFRRVGYHRLAASSVTGTGRRPDRRRDARICRGNAASRCRDAWSASWGGRGMPRPEYVSELGSGH